MTASCARADETASKVEKSDRRRMRPLTNEISAAKTADDESETRGRIPTFSNLGNTVIRGPFTTSRKMGGLSNVKSKSFLKKTRRASFGPFWIVGRMRTGLWKEEGA